MRTQGRLLSSKLERQTGGETSGGTTAGWRRETWTLIDSCWMLSVDRPERLKTLGTQSWVAVWLSSRQRRNGTTFKKYIFLKMLLIFREGEKHQCVAASWAHPLLGTWLATQVCALTGNQTSNLWVYRPALNPLSHTSQGDKWSHFEEFSAFCS